LLVFADADTAVLDFKAEVRLLVVLMQQFHAHDNFALAGKFDGVADQIGQDLAQSNRISLDGDRQLVRDAAKQLDPFGCSGLGK